jgi:acetate kinase
MVEQKIRHMVIFTLKYNPDAAESLQFLRDGQTILSSIPGVELFSAFHQISPKNDYDFGFSMDFADQAAYDSYNVHPLHVDFVTNRWQKEVVRFLEIDFQAIKND